ncbi:MAG: 4-(cytidine 5'-diphospho)-2-C-methyl-D-erythritol kinase [Ruminococcaceae bacterium]|nr:4-(cytidine 5'-diphospho)-2-C-methyl-D-erythritol kinase [Oscillospiraceae bacterium]
MIAREAAYAKINLSLDVVGRRADGYHELVSVMQTVTLCDDLTFEKMKGEEILLSADLAQIAHADNLIVRAAKAYFAAARAQFGVKITLHKRIPMQAGLGGGSADAAATLRALNRLDGDRFSPEELCRIAVQIGADVPFCVMGGTRLCRGIGERMQETENRLSCSVVLVMADEGISTPEAFRALDEIYGDFSALTPAAQLRADRLTDALEKGALDGAAEEIYNRFEEVILPVRPHAAQMKQRLLAAGARVACMSGSGPALFALFEKEQEAKAIVSDLQKEGKTAYVCRFA